jgi:predicted membrane protein DUF2079
MSEPRADLGVEPQPVTRSTFVNVADGDPVAGEDRDVLDPSPVFEPRRHGRAAHRIRDERQVIGLRSTRPLWIVGLPVFGLEAALLIGWSAFQWHRYALGLDFSIYNQGAYLLAHGHLNPWSSIDGFSFLRDHFTLLMWPLALLYALFPHPITLLILQDLASLGAGLVAFRWILEILEYRQATSHGILSRRTALVIGSGALLAAVANPWVWQADGFDFHMEAFAALFIVLASRDFWRHRPLRALIWCGLVLLAGDFGGLFVVGLGLSVTIAAVGYRRWGLATLGAGAAWTLMVHGFNLSNGDLLSNYAGIVYGSTPNPGPVTLTNLLGAMVRHPNRWMSLVGQKRGLVYENAIPTGILGLFNPWTFGVTWVILLSATLIGPSIYLQSGFQCLPAFAVGLVGTVLTVVAVVTHGDASRHRAIRLAVVGVVGVAVLAQVVGLSIVMMPRTSGNWVRVSEAQATQLNRVEAATPGNAQVIASDGVMGRFSDRQWVEPIRLGTGSSYDITSPVVVFVIVPFAGIEGLPSASALAVVRYLESTLHVAPIVQRDGVYGFRWVPGPGVHTVTLPSA